MTSLVNAFSLLYFLCNIEKNLLKCETIKMNCLSDEAMLLGIRELPLRRKGNSNDSLNCNELFDDVSRTRYLRRHQQEENVSNRIANMSKAD